jgi:hypothetical protein
MIRIQEHLNRPDADQFLDGLALRLWNHFNKKLANGSGYHYHSLVKRLDRLVLQTDEAGYFSDYANNDQDLLNRQKQFLNYLKANDYAKIKSLVVSRPRELTILRDEIFLILETEDLYFHNGGVKQTTFGKLLVDELFIYKNFRKSPICHELISEMNLENSYCPYCNYNRIQLIDIRENDNDAALIRAYLDFDHFYPKSQNPFFALSFYNLIPSCHLCNSAEKRDKEFQISTHTNPFHKSYNSNHKFEIDKDWSAKGSTDNLILNKVTPPDDFMNRDLSLNQRYRHTFLKAVNDFMLDYQNYQHYREDQNIDFRDLILRRVPVSPNEILKKDGGKMFRDILMEIDVFGLLD